MGDKLMAFTWGYWGWGESTPELVGAFDEVEQSRGWRPPLFVDVRAKREVRATGFRGAAFENLLGHARYRWMPGLGNAAVATGRGPMRLNRPQDADDLLELILRHHDLRCRVVFFCSCESPWGAGQCHRQLLATTLLERARSGGVSLWLQEWPGEALSAQGALFSIPVPPGTLRSLVSGRRWVMTEGRPKADLLGVPIGSLVSLEEGGNSRLASICPPRLVNGRWKLQLFVEDEVGRTRSALLEEARSRRTELVLESRRS